MDIQTAIEDLNALVLSGKALEAFEKYYDESIVMVEKNDVLAEGKDANRKREEEFFANITEFRGAEVKAVAVGENVSMVEWHFDYVHKEWGHMKYDQVAVAKWKDGKIVHERFYALY
ncbi:MAG: SnoaL-like domain-containing protein [Opitutales bacterium]